MGNSPIRLIADGTALTAEPGGARARFLSLFPALAKRDGVSVTAVIRRGCGLEEQLAAAGVTLAFAQSAARPLARLFVPLHAAAARAAASCGKGPADSHGPLFAFCAETLPLPPLGRTPLFLTLHDLRFLYPEWSSFPRRFYARTLLRRNLKRASAVIAVSRTTAEALAASGLVSGERIFSVPNAPAFSPILASDRASLLLSRLGVRPPYLLSLARMERRKNIPALLDAFEIFLRRGDRRETLILAGSARRPEGPAIRRRIAASVLLRGKVTLTGAVDEEERAALLAGAAGFVQPSLYEGFGMGIVEAMACGIPVACSAIPAHRETAGEAGLFFDPGVPEEMARILRQLTGSPELSEGLVAAGREQAARYSWDRSAKLFEEGVRRVLERGTAC
jgi:glycosyltransferase involved in cell wall biosynthesis